MGGLQLNPAKPGFLQPMRKIRASGLLAQDSHPFSQGFFSKRIVFR
jgi:hypothetical protein